jgi:hypothetical protein
MGASRRREASGVPVTERPQASGWQVFWRFSAIRRGPDSE